MANRTKLDEVEAQRPGAYQKGQSVLDAERAVRDQQALRPGEYEKGQSVLDAERAVQDQQALRPGDYQSRWDTQIQSMLDRVQSRPEFQYDFNADPLYQMYRQQYTQLGRQAAANAAAESAALTGGFGNSYATSAAAQANQNYLNMLNGIIPDLYDRAADRYDAEGAELWRQFGTLQDLEETDYDRYRDRYGDWEQYLEYLTGRADTEYSRDYGQYRDAYDDWERYLEYLTGRADTEYDRDYGQYTDQYQQWQDWLNYWMNDYNDQVAQDQWAAELAEQQRQYNESLAFDREQFAYQQAQDALAAQQAAAQAAASSGGSGGSKSSGGSGTSTAKKSAGNGYVPVSDLLQSYNNKTDEALAYARQNAGLGYEALIQKMYANGYSAAQITAALNQLGITKPTTGGGGGTAGLRRSDSLM